MFYSSRTHLLGFSLFVFLLSCQSDTPIKKDSDRGYEVTIQHAAGDDFTFEDASSSYLNYPFNMGYFRGQQSDYVHCIVLSKKLSVRSRLMIKPIAVFNTYEQGIGNSYIIAVPSDDQMKSLSINDFSDLVTKHNAVKSIIELWILNRCGMGCSENLSWGNENSAAFVLEALNKS